MDAEVKNIGLRGVTVADSKISFVDGNQGKLYYRGYAIEDLAQNASYEEVVYLLLMGKLPNDVQLEKTKQAMAKARELPTEFFAFPKARPATGRTMDLLQGMIAFLADYDPDIGSENRQDMVNSALRLVARTAMVVAAHTHLVKGTQIVTPDSDLGHAGAFLHALWGKRPTQDEERLMNTLLIIHAEHTFNASTFAAREVASTRAHIYACASSAVGALSGALHGGANARVMEMLLEIGSEEKVEEWVVQRINNGQRVMGLGHAVYKTNDPRAVILQEIARKVLHGRPEEKYFKLAQKVDLIAQQKLQEMKGLRLYPNVDFFSGSILYALGLPLEFFPPFFAVARVAGWSAHVIEEQMAEAQPKSALYRPKAQYTGRLCGPQGCKFIPIESRGAGCPCGKDLLGCDEALALEEIEYKAS